VARDVFKQYQDIELIYTITHPDGRTERLVHAFPMRYLFRYKLSTCWCGAASKWKRCMPTTTRAPMAQNIPAS